MSTKSLIDRMVPFANGWNRTGTKSIIRLIQEGQDKLLNYDASYMRYVDAADNKGFPPYLETTAGTYKYDVTAANLSVASLYRTIGGTNYTVRAKRVLRVFVDVSTSDYNKKWVGEPFLYYFPNPYSISTDRTCVAPVPVEKGDCLESTSAWVMFKEDPGTELTKYFCEFTWEAPRLTAETIPLVVPEDMEDAIENYVLGRIQWLSNGKPNEFLIEFERRRTEYQLTMAAEAQADNNETVVRPC